MSVVIYGKEGCVDCNKAKLLCQMKSVEFEYLTVGSDISLEKLAEEVGQQVSSVPQIFMLKMACSSTWVVITNYANSSNGCSTVGGI